MANSTVLSVRISPANRAKLDQLAAAHQRSRSFLAERAISEYVEQELAIVEKILKGMEDVKAGRVSPHDEVMAEMDEIISQAEARRATDAA